MTKISNNFFFFLSPKSYIKISLIFIKKIIIIITFGNKNKISLLFSCAESKAAKLKQVAGDDNDGNIILLVMMTFVCITLST